MDRVPDNAAEEQGKVMATRILIADDIEILRNNVRMQLSRQDDFEIVYAASSGYEAYAESLRLHPDIVVMDMEMEEVDSGIIYSQKILNELPETRIIILTVHEESDLVLEAFESGVVDYVIKEASCENLINHIRKAVEDRIVFDSNINKLIHNEFMKLRREKNEINNLYRTFITLTPSEREIIRLLYDGHSVKEIAECRFVETITIKKQITNILRKFSMRRTKEIVSLIKEINAEGLLFEDLIGRNDE